MEFQRTPWFARGRLIVDDRPIIMGIVNVTPDSFSDGGRNFAHHDAVENAMRLVDEGADILDVGGESSRPGADVVSLEEELHRVVPVVEALRSRTEVPISVDTTKSEVARQALLAGADIINDITALGDPLMTQVVVKFQAGLVLMHMPGTPQTMQANANYQNVTEEVIAYLQVRIAKATAAGVPLSSIAVDPGIGFGKTTDHNLELLRHTAQFATLGCPVLIGTSRKGFLGTLTGRDVSQRATASVVSSLLAVDRGASIVRVHDVGPMRDAIRIWMAYQD